MEHRNDYGIESKPALMFLAPLNEARLGRSSSSAGYGKIARVTNHRPWTYLFGI
jgi:hypothetical protein